MEKIIYLVSDGEYSDYRIVQVFSTKEKAESYIEIAGGYLEEYGIDIDYENSIPNYKKGYYPYKILYNKTTKEFSFQKRTWSTYQNNVNYCLPAGDKDNNIWVIECVAEDEKHALKISNERISQMIAMNYINMGFKEYWNLKFGEGNNFKDI